MTLGERIRKYRKAAGFTQKELGEKVGIDEVSISRYEGNYRVPRMNTLIEIADILHTTVASLMDDVEEETPVVIKVDDINSYCDMVSETYTDMMHRCLDGKTADNLSAYAYFEKQMIFWKYNVPSMVKEILDGSWKKKAEQADREQSEGVADNGNRKQNN